MPLNKRVRPPRAGKLLFSLPPSSFSSPRSMPPTSIAVALLKVVTLPTHSHPSPCTHPGLVYCRGRRKNSIPSSHALRHEWLRKRAAPRRFSAAAAKNTNSDCGFKVCGCRTVVTDLISGRFNPSSTMIGSGISQSVVAKRDLRRMPRNWAAGDLDRGDGVADKDEQENSVNGITHHLKENRSVGIKDADDGEDSKSLDQQSRLLTIPTVLTLGRVAAVPLLITTFYMDGRWATTATTSIFILASVTDWLDGYIARKMRLGSTFGAFLDPVADKLMVAAALVLLCTKPLEVALFSHAPWLLTLPSIAVIGREITMSAVREWAASQNSGVLEAVAVNNLGKWKTATQMTALTILLASRDSSLAGQTILVASGLTLLNISAALAVWSLAVYMRKIWRVLLK